MVSPAVQLSKKIPDKKLQVWAASLLAGEWAGVFPNVVVPHGYLVSSVR